MPTNDLTYLNGYYNNYAAVTNIERPLTIDEQIAIHSGKIPTNIIPTAFEEIAKKKFVKDFEDFLVSNDAVKVERKVRELERQGYIVVVDKPKPMNEEISPETKSFIAGLLTGIGLMILLL